MQVPAWSLALLLVTLAAIEAMAEDPEGIARLDLDPVVVARARSAFCLALPTRLRRAGRKRRQKRRQPIRSSATTRARSSQDLQPSRFCARHGATRSARAARRELRRRPRSARVAPAGRRAAAVFFRRAMAARRWGLHPSPPPCGEGLGVGGIRKERWGLARKVRVGDPMTERLGSPSSRPSPTRGSEERRRGRGGIAPPRAPRHAPGCGRRAAATASPLPR